MVDPVGRARLVDWVRDERGMPWEPDVVEAVAARLGVSPWEVRREAFDEDELGRPVSRR